MRLYHAFCCIYCWIRLITGGGIYFDFHREQDIEVFAATQGKEILLDTGSGMEPFEIRGVDMGVGIPGYFSTEFAIDKETYLRWFGLIQEMGANTIRVYTILEPDFYEAVYEYNKENPTPLYILHGVWVNDYVQNSHVDAYDDSFREVLLQDCRTLVDVIHGRKKISLGYQASSASGVYKRYIRLGSGVYSGRGMGRCDCSLYGSYGYG